VNPSSAAAASSGAAPAVGSIDVATLAARAAAGAPGASLVLVRCAPPCEPLERAATSELAPPPHAGLASWEAWFVGDEGYMLRGARADGGVEWYALVLAPDDAVEAAPDGTRPHPRSEGADAAPALRPSRTVLVGWRPLGRGNAAQWSVAWRRQ
jgi:hypothetical protein